MSYVDRDVAATLERLYPPVIGGPGWEDVLDRLDSECLSPPARSHGDARGGTPRLGRARWSSRSLLVAAVAGAVVAATPALALSTTVRQFVGLSKSTSRATLGWTRPHLVARVTGVSFPKRERFGLPMATVRFTIGEPGKQPGTGVTFGSYFLVHLASKSGAPSAPYFVRARASHGHYVVTAPLPRGGIGSIEIGGWINVRTGPSAANGTFWIPVAVSVQQY